MNPKLIAFITFVLLIGYRILEAADIPTNTAPIAQAAPKTVLITTHVTDAPALPVAISATDPNIRYIGRFDLTKGDPRCAWTASTIMLKFQGTELNVQLEDSGTNYWEVEIDGKPVQKMALGDGSHLYRVATGLAQTVHSVRLVRATEARDGPTQIHGFQVDNKGSLQFVDAPVHRLEVIGDSITCGAWNEGQPGKEDPEQIDENGYFSYGAIVARKLGLDYHCVAWSGRKMWPNKTIPSIYHLAIPTEKGTVWDFTKWSPEAIVINLSTNDWNRGPVDEAQWTGAYETFLALLRSHFPNAEIYCATSPMLLGDRLENSKVYIKKVVSDLNASGDARVRYLEFETQDPKNGIGGARHPNVQTDEIMADKLAAQLTADLGWPPIEK